MIERRHLRESVRELIRERIVRRQLPENQSIGEIALAEEFGVSRTPVRETLLGLERDGFVKAIPGRGFVVQPLSADEARQLYPIVWGLETLAIREAGKIPAAAIAELRSLNARLGEATTPEERTRHDTEWHRSLVAIGGNRRLGVVLEGVKASIARYEHAFLGAADRRDHSVADHERIIRLLDQDPARAAEALETHWREGLRVVLAAIPTR